MRVVALALVFASAAVLAQVPPSVGPRFDVVSIKRNVSNALGSNGSSERPDGGFTLLNIPIMTLVGRAQFPPIPPVDMVGLPEWARSERYDISATSTLRRPATPEERAGMLRQMLGDRVKLVTHVEKREMAVYDLVRARNDGRLGPGIRPSEVDCVAKATADRAAADAAIAAGNPPPPPTRPTPGRDGVVPPCSGMFMSGGMQGDATMANFAMLLRGMGGANRPVIDKTGLTGSYRITLQFDQVGALQGPDTTASSGNLPSLFTALPDQLGLKLEPSKAERDVLVIDRLERPTEN